MIVVSEKKPDITVKGKDTYLSLWIGSRVRISISRRTNNGFERIDSYTIPLDYLLFKSLERSRDVLKRYCEFVLDLEEE